MQLIEKLVVSFFILISINVTVYAENFLNYMPSNKNILITAGHSSQVTYQITNISGVQLNDLIYDPNYPHNTGVLIDNNLTSCQGSLEAGASCSLTLTIKAPQQVGTYYLSPRICSDNGLICSVPKIENQAIVTVVNTPNMPLDLSVDMLDSDQHLQTHALILQNSGAQSVTLLDITATLAPALQGKVKICNANISTLCTPPKAVFPACTDNLNLMPGAQCLVWLYSIDNINQPLGSVSGPVTLNIVTSPTTELNKTEFTLKVNNDLYAGGKFRMAGGNEASRIARWNGSTWSTLSSGVTGGSQLVNALTIYRHDLIIGGDFTAGGGIENINNIARWNSSKFSGLGSGLAGGDLDARALKLLSNRLIVGGDFSNAGGVADTEGIAAWDGTNWSALGTGMDGAVYALNLFNNRLIAGGRFTSAGGVSASRVAEFDGVNTWSALSSGVTSGGPVVQVLDSYKDYLVVGGQFNNAGGIVGVNNIANWNGSSFSALANGVEGSSRDVLALAKFRNYLIVGGNFSSANGLANTDGIAAWDGTSWSALGTGMNGDVHALAVLDANTLFAGGQFTNAGGIAASRIAQWNGTSWSPLSSGFNRSCNALLIASSLTIMP